MASMKSLCTPAMVYLVLAVISILMASRYVSMMSLTSKAIFALVWTWFLNFLCSKGHTGISWFLVLIPYVLIVMMMLLAMDAAGKSSKKDGFQGWGITAHRNNRASMMQPVQGQLEKNKSGGGGIVLGHGL